MLRFSIFLVKSMFLVILLPSPNSTGEHCLVIQCNYTHITATEQHFHMKGRVTVGLGIAPLVILIYSLARISVDIVF